ncbi:MAG: DUF1592 domain-containing protein [Pseudomonadales bacterium]|jgi:hypothetical protein|nr:DUF1592 domain-containing protein [Pseudomonadales bacterium]
MIVRIRTLLLALACLAVLGCESEPEPAEPTASATPPRTRLLTGEQYSNAIAQVFGDDVSESVLPPMPPMARTDGLLASGAQVAGLTSDQLSQIQQAALAVSARVFDETHRRYLVPCEPVSVTGADEECARSFLRETGRLLQRRPMDDAPLDELVSLAGRAAVETGDFYEGLAIALEAILISPDFLYITDRSEPDPARLGELRLDAFSLASRLSFFLWNAPPDDALLDAAESGALYTEAGLEAAVDRLLSSPRLEDGMRAFFDDMFAFDEFDSLAKDPNVYPMVTGATLRDAREQTLRTVIDHLITRGADYRDLFTTRRTFMSMQLAAVYGTPAERGWRLHEFDADGPRAGVLTHMSFLAAHSHSVRSSPTLRGKALRELFLCQNVPLPPPNVDFSKIEDAGDVPTARERLKVHNENPSCAGCHLVTDPIGLALENFDGAGRWRDTENGVEIDASGELDGVFYDEVSGLTQALREHPKLSACLVERLFAYGSGGPVSMRHDRDALDWFEARFVDAGHRLPALLKDLATSEAFTTLRLPEDAGSEIGSVAEAGVAGHAESAGRALAANEHVESAR